MPSSKLFRQAIISQMLVVAPGAATAGMDAAESVPVREHRRPSCATSTKFSEVRLEHMQQAQQKQGQAPASASALSYPSGSSRSHIIRSVSKLFAKSRGKPVPELARGRPRQRRTISGGSNDDSERMRARSPPKVASTKARVSMPRVHRMVKAPMKAVPSPAYKPVRSRPFTIIEAVQTGTSVVAVNHLRTLPVAKAAPTSSLSEPKVKRGPSPLSQSFWTSPDESIPRTPPVPAVPVGTPADLPPAADARDESAMNWEPVPPPMIRTLSSTTASSSSSIPPTPIDEDTVMVDVFDVDFSASVDVLPFAEDKHAKLEDSTLLPSRPMKPLPVRRRPRAPVEVPMPPAASTDDEAGTLIASDSELERQLWADMNDILGHEDEPARFCFPPEGIPAVAFLPASVPPPVVAVVGRSFPAFSANDADSDSDESLLEAFHPAAKTVPEVVVTPATPAVVSRADFKEAGTQRSVVAPARSMDDLWEEFFGPEVDV